MKLVYYGSHVVTAEPTPEPSPWATGVNAHKGGPDLARAKQLMSDAGVGSGLTLTYLVKSQVPVLVKTGEILREQLKKIGITLDVRPLESGQYFEELVGKKFDVAAAWWSVSVDPDLFYYPMQHSSSPWNFCGFKSEEADRRLDAFRTTTNPAARKKMYPDLVRWLQEEGSLLIFSNEIQRYWMKPNVQGSVPLSSLELRFEDTWLSARAMRRAHLLRWRPRPPSRSDVTRRVRLACGHRAPPRSWTLLIALAGFLRQAPSPLARAALMSAWVYAARRLMLAVPLLLGMSVLVFGLMRLVPGDPAVTVLGYKATPEAVRALREAFHLDEPLPRQYLAWLGGVARGDFGLDFRQNEPIGRMILDRLPVTLELTLLAALAAALIGVPLGLLGGGGRRGGAADRASLAVGLLGVSLPDFWLGIMLILLVSLGTGLLPSSGFVPFTESPVENLLHLILPAITLAASRAAVLGRLTRAAVLDTVRRGFVQYARAKGLAERAVLFRHVLPNAAIPIVTVLGLQTGYMLGGAIVVETIFTLPGVGRMTLDAVLERNYPVVQGTLLVIGAMFMLVNLVTDILYGVIDPRVRRR